MYTQHKSKTLSKVIASEDTEHTYSDISAILEETDGVSHCVSQERRYDALRRRLGIFQLTESLRVDIVLMILLDDTARRHVSSSMISSLQHFDNISYSTVCYVIVNCNQRERS